jgi:hypothetical protein
MHAMKEQQQVDFVVSERRKTASAAKGTAGTDCCLAAPPAETAASYKAAAEHAQFAHSLPTLPHVMTADNQGSDDFWFAPT